MASKLTKKINSRFNPTLLSGYPVYAYGGLMKKYAGGGFMIPTDLQQEFIKQGTENTNLANLGLNIADTMGETIAGISNTARPNKPNYGVNIGAGALKGTAQGAAIGSIVPGVGTLIGGAIGGISGTISGLGKSIVKDQEIKQQEEVEKQGRIDTLKKQMISNLPAQHYYQPTFAMGGKISPSEIAKGTKEEMEHTSSKKVSRKTAMDHLKEDPKYYTKLKEAGLADAYAKGGMLNSYANGGNLDNTTVFQGGGSHQENQLGGIPQGTNALVEEGEVRFKDYIFSNRIPYTKKK